MATVTLSASVKPQSFPVGTVGGLWRFLLNPVDSTGVAQDTPEPMAVFSDVAAGDYTASVQRLDGLGVPLGDSVSISFAVAAEIAVVNVPDALTVEITP